MSLTLAGAAQVSSCTPDEGQHDEGTGTSESDGDGDPGDGDPGDGDPGDGDPGDGDPGDGDPGDGDPGDGDGDPGGDWADLCDVAPTIGDAHCGDGLVGLGEGCDDGNLDDADGCSNTCETNHAIVASFAVSGRTQVAVLADPDPTQSTLTLLEANDAIVHAHAVDGALLWSSAPAGGWAQVLRTLPDGTSFVAGWDSQDGVSFPWTARVDTQGQLQGVVAQAARTRSSVPLLAPARPEHAQGLHPSFCREFQGDPQSRVRRVFGVKMRSLCVGNSSPGLA